MSAPCQPLPQAGGTEICIFDVGRPVREIEPPRVPYFLTGRVVMNLRWPNCHDKMAVQMLRCSKCHEKMIV